MTCTQSKYQLRRSFALVGMQWVVINILILRKKCCIDVYCTDHNIKELQHPKDKPANQFGYESIRTTKILCAHRCLVGVLEPAES